MEEEQAAPPAEAASEEIVKLTRWANVYGEPTAHGKVLRLPADEAQRLIAAGDAVAATEFDKKIAGVI
jgi:hypothetical protein